jgi:hypothetical protein
MSSVKFTRCKRISAFYFVIGFIFYISVERFSPHVIASESSATSDIIKPYVVPQISSTDIPTKTNFRSAIGFE